MSKSKQSFVKKNVFLTIGKMLLGDVTEFAYFRNLFAVIRVLCMQSALCLSHLGVLRINRA
jgi:hypothetical protein